MCIHYILNTVWMMQELLSSEQEHSETSVLELLPNPTGFQIQLSHITTQLHTFVFALIYIVFQWYLAWDPIF